MKKIIKNIVIMALLLTVFIGITAPLSAYAADESAVMTEEAAEATVTSAKAIAAGIAIGLAAGAGAIGMAIAIGKSSEGISRQPEAEGSIRTTMMLGLVFIETAIIYALIVAILIIFVL